MYPRLVLANDVLYTNGGRKVAPNGFPILDRIAKAAKDLQARVVIEGHTAATPPPAASRVPSNWELSTYRAANVGRYLVEAADLPPESIQIVGHGHFRGGAKPADQVVIVFLYTTPDEAKAKAAKR
jgi:chemotaxis protein MotB